MSDESPAVRIELAQQLWESLRSRYHIEISHYNAMLRVRVENEQPFSLEEILHDLESRKLKPNVATFEQIVRNYSRDGDLYGVNRTLDTMKENHIDLSRGIYNSLILAHAAAG